MPACLNDLRGLIFEHPTEGFVGLHIMFRRL
jgi:hypothetical protein